LQQIISGALDVLDDAIAVQTASLRKSFQNQQVQASLKIVSPHPDTSISWCTRW
jgi:hypothetical protein